MPPADSSTTLLGLFGHPVEHSLSPSIHNAAFRAVGLNWVYLAFEVTPETLEAALNGCRALGMPGLNITHPLKRSVIPFLDGLSKEAELIGAVNTVHFTEGKAKGFNTDGRGFIAALQEEKGFPVRDKTVFVIGAGGAGRAVAVQSALEGAGRILLADLESERAEEVTGLINGNIRKGLAESLKVGGTDWEEKIAHADLVVDATPLGMKDGDPLSFDPALLSSAALLVDLVYSPPQTRLLAEARRLGKAGLNGLGMLIRQAALAWEIWTGRPAPLEVMKEAARKALK